MTQWTTMDIYRLKEKRMTVRVLSNTLGSNDEDDEDDEEDRRDDRREDVMWNGGVVFNFIRKGRQRKRKAQLDSRRKINLTLSKQEMESQVFKTRKIHRERDGERKGKPTTERNRENQVKEKNEKEADEYMKNINE